MNEKREMRKMTEKNLDELLKKVLKDKHTRLEFIRAGKGEQPRQKRGVMIAFVDPDETDKVIVGFSLCHKHYDSFDRMVFGIIKQEDFGKKIAFRRALKNVNKIKAEVYSDELEYKEVDKVYIPATVHASLQNFVARCKKYYKDKFFPVWVDEYIS